MPVPPTNPQDTHSAITVLIAIAACLCIAYWRIALRVILIVLLALVIYGAVAASTAWHHLYLRITDKPPVVLPPRCGRPWPRDGRNDRARLLSASPNGARRWARIRRADLRIRHGGLRLWA
jgi:hypothetical protein